MVDIKFFSNLHPSIKNGNGENYWFISSVIGHIMVLLHAKNHKSD
jgi:hypothetical protein